MEKPEDFERRVRNAVTYSRDEFPVNGNARIRILHSGRQTFSACRVKFQSTVHSWTRHSLLRTKRDFAMRIVGIETRDANGVAFNAPFNEINHYGAEDTTIYSLCCHESPATKNIARIYAGSAIGYDCMAVIESGTQGTQKCKCIAKIPFDLSGILFPFSTLRGKTIARSWNSCKWTMYTLTRLKKEFSCKEKCVYINEI